MDNSNTTKIPTSNPFLTLDTTHRRTSSNPFDNIEEDIDSEPDKDIKISNPFESIEEENTHRKSTNPFDSLPLD